MISAYPTLKQLERSIIETRMQIYEGNVSRAAYSLGICTDTLYTRLARYADYDKRTKETK